MRRVSSVPYTFPDWQVLIKGDRQLTKAEFASSSLTMATGFGAAAAYTLDIVGVQARDLLDSGVLEFGGFMTDILAGYDGDYHRVARNQRIWDVSYSGGEGGSRLTVTAYGASQFLRRSGNVTKRLTAKTYEQAFHEVCGRHGIKAFVGEGAFKPLPFPEAAKTASGSTSASSITPSLPQSGGQASSRTNALVFGIARGIALGNLDFLTGYARNTPLYCAQFVREVVERALGLGTGSWPVYTFDKTEQSYDFRNTSAIGYGRGMQSLGLTLPASTPLEPGMIGVEMQGSGGFGHIWIYLGDFNGVPSVIHNTSGYPGIQVYGSGPVKITPLSALSAWQIVGVAALDKKEVAEKPRTKASSVASTTSANLIGNAAGAGITATVTVPTKPASVSEGASAERKQILQEGKDDWSFVTDLAKQIGYIAAETDDGSGIYFGPGLEVGSRNRFLMVLGDYSINQQPVKANVKTFTMDRSIYDIPSEIVVTGIEGGKVFNIITTPEELAARHKVVAETLKPASETPAVVPSTVSPDVLRGAAGRGITATATANPTQSKKAKKAKEVSLGAGDFAGKAVRELLVQNKTTRQLVVGGSSSRADAKARGLEGLSLEQLKFQTVSLECIGIPFIKAGHEILFFGSEVPLVAQGLYLVRTVNGTEDSTGGYSMSLTIVRNTT